MLTLHDVAGKLESNPPVPKNGSLKTHTWACILPINASGAAIPDTSRSATPSSKGTAPLASPKITVFPTLSSNRHLHFFRFVWKSSASTLVSAEGET
jgi:hypothetical protein